MARTKRPNPTRTSGRSAAVGQKVPRAVALKRAPTPNARPYGFHPGTRARMEIRKLQRTTNLQIKRRPFERLVREISQDYMSTPRFQPKAVDALHSAAEDYITKLLEDANLLANHAKRVTLYHTDIRLARRIRGEIA